MDQQSMDGTQWHQLTSRAQDLTRAARRFVHDRPLQAIAVTIGVGFVVGKIVGARHD